MKKLLVLFSLFAAIKTSGQTDQSALASQAFKKGNWSEAIQLYKAYRTGHQTDNNSLYNIGSSEIHLKDYRAAVTYLDSAILFSDAPDELNRIRFQLARCYSALNDKEKAFYYLDEAASHGCNYYQALNDTLFAAIRHDQKFQNISEQINTNLSPGTFDPRYRKFNFFVGAWNVFLGDKFDQKVAVDTVTQMQGGYAVFENFKWTGGGNYTGKSMSFFDPSTQKYRMCWAGSSGDIRNFEEIHTEENVIQLLAITKEPNNMLVHRRMTITYNPSDDSIHQYIENSTDFGKTWRVAFDAMFRKQKESTPH